MSRTTRPETGLASATLAGVLRDDALRASHYRDGDDPWPTLEALSRALFAQAAGALESLATNERDAIARAGRRALLSVGSARDGDDAQDAQDAIALARAGLTVLGGQSLADARGPRDAMHVPDGRLARATRGELDGFSMGALALHVAGCGDCATRLEVLGGDCVANFEREGASVAGSTQSLPLRVAARSAVPMRRPAEGRVVLTLDDPSVEIVLFEDEGTRSLAVYAEQPVGVRLVAPTIETIDVLTGYWLGRIADESRIDAVPIEVELHHGERVMRVTLAL